MDEDKRKQMMFEWLRSEQDFSNDRISGYSEADIKIVSIIATIIVAVIGLCSGGKIGDISSLDFSYLMFLTSSLLSLAVTGSIYYSSLTMLFRKRKLAINSNMADFLGVSRDFTAGEHSLFRLKGNKAYYVSIRGYFIFKALGPVALFHCWITAASSRRLEMGVGICGDGDVSFVCTCGYDLAYV